VANSNWMLSAPTDDGRVASQAKVKTECGAICRRRDSHRECDMEKAIRVVSIDKGFDTRDFSLVAFGGAGAMHACELAAALEMPRVIVPGMPGALSALGILMSNVVKDYSLTLLWPVSGRFQFRRSSPSLRSWKQPRKKISSLKAGRARLFLRDGWRFGTSDRDLRLRCPRMRNLSHSSSRTSAALRIQPRKK